jgi:hypothetical protein
MFQIISPCFPVGSLDIRNAIGDFLDVVILPKLQHLVFDASEIRIGGSITTEPFVNVFVEMGGANLFRNFFHFPAQVLLGRRGSGNVGNGCLGGELTPEVNPAQENEN